MQILVTTFSGSHAAGTGQTWDRLGCQYNSRSGAVNRLIGIF